VDRGSVELGRRRGGNRQRSRRELGAAGDERACVGTVGKLADVWVTAGDERARKTALGQLADIWVTAGDERARKTTLGKLADIWVTVGNERACVGTVRASVG